MYAAGGRDANESRTAEDPSGFTDTIDTSQKKPGRYNFYLEAIDRAGNITHSGPENIYIDPESDLPQVTIINPMLGLRVQGNLNIVGIAVDDDGIQKVELTVNRGTTGRGEELVRVTANGTDYWSYLLNTTDPEIWTDGFYTITAWATDINGLSGIADQYANGSRVNPRSHKLHTVVWNLDRKKPETIITSHETGALVSGNIRMRGTVADGNGINSLSYSIDGGERYLPVRINQDRRTGEYTWEININTRTLEDGPAVIWFEARDGNNTLGTAAHLLFINNTGPEVKIVYPTPDTVVNGLFSIAGYARHPVGLKRVSWRAGRMTGDVDLLPGNHWWSANIDLRGLKENNIDIEIRAEDVSGNVTFARQRYRVDQNRDLPVVTLIEPTAGTLNGNELIVRGNVRDNEGVESIFYSLNGTTPVEIPCTGYFQFLIKQVPEGTNTLEVWAKDITGIIGPRVQVRGIVVNGAPPIAGITSIVSGAGRAQPISFNSGMIIKPEPIINPRSGLITGYERLTMNVSFTSAVPITSASVTFGNANPVPLRLSSSRDVFTASVPLPDNLPAGLLGIQLKAADRLGREVIFNEYIFIEPHDTPAQDFIFSWVRPNTLNDGRILLGEQEEILMGVSSIPLRSVTVTGTGANNVSAEIDQRGRVILRVINEGEIGPLTLRVQGDETAYQIDPIRILADFSYPSIMIQNVIPNNWVRTSVPVRFNVSSRNRITAVDFSTDMGRTWTSFLTPAEISALRIPVNTELNRTIDISSMDDGSIYLMIRASNEAGKTTIANLTVQKDTQAPVVTLAAPIPEARVNGTIRLAFAIEEAGMLNTITYNRPARAGVPAITREVFNADNWEGNYQPRFIEVLMDSVLMPLDENKRFIFTDKAGNTTEFNSWHFVIAPEDDIPVVHIVLPLEDEVITADFIVSGVMYDDDGIKNAHWRLNNGQWQVQEAENGFSIPISISSLTDNEHTVSVFAEDIYGVRSQPVTRRFRVSLSEPTAALTFPLVESVLRDVVELRGTAFDRNGIQDVKVSLDNGNTFNTVRGTFGTAAENVQWTYQFNTRILEDGPHVVFIRVTDRYDISSTYASMINVDNTPPEIVLDSPGDGSISTGKISVMGRVIDPTLQEVNIQLRSLDGITIQPALRNRRLDPNPLIREEFDLTGQPDGHYNIAVIGTDKAGNITRVSRNFELARQNFRNFVEILYPLENETVSGEFNLYGFAGGSEKAGTATVRVNGRDIETNDVDESGYFRFNLNSENLNEGSNTIIVHSNFGGGAQVSSRSYTINYNLSGPWITIDSFSFGNFAYDRPYVFGRTGYILSEEDKELLSQRTTDKITRAQINSKAHSFTEISFDNGKTFVKTGGRQGRNIDYRYRLETGEMLEGIHYIIVRSTMKNGETAVTRMLVQVDKTPPIIRLISPEMGGRYNTEIAYSASATDDVELVSLTYHLRIGDKAAYEIPGFIQGLYFEMTIPPFIRQAAPDVVPSFFAGGATYMDFGLGLSFFDDNVKVQGNFGFMSEQHYESLGGLAPGMRYGGNVMGIKLLASIYSLPFASFLGPDWEWLFATVALGANFSLFEITQSGSPTWLSALLLQVEFPRVSIPKRTSLRTFSVFTEVQCWFSPTDMAKNDTPTIIPKVIMGLRVYIF